MSATPIPISDLTLEAVTTPEEILVRCSGRITSRTSNNFQTKVRSLILETKTVVLDLTDVNQIDSSGLGALVSVYMSARRRGCELKLINLSQRLQDLFRITKLFSVFEGRGENYFEGY
jgi:anti-anti-sigma factor